MSQYNIRTIISLNEIPFEDFNLDDCVAFDLDDTVFIESIKIMRTTNYHKRKLFVEGLRCKGGNERVSFLFDNLTYQLVEDCILDKLKLQNVNSFGFTARRTGKATPDQKILAEDKTLNLLKSLNVRFKSIFNDCNFDGINESNPTYRNILIDSTLRPFDLPGDVMIRDQVVFCNNIDKGTVLKIIFDKFNYMPKHFILIDDKLENLLSVAKSIESFNPNIQFIGYHYIGSNNFDSQVSDDIIAKQMEHLLQNPPILLGD